MSAETPPDIEIYIANTKAADVLTWLATRFAEHGQPRPAGKRQWRQQLQFEGRTIPVLVIEEASPGFTSVWFDSPQTPWADDMACAREAFAHFQQEVRAIAGSWDEEADPDEWWRIDVQGETVIRWPS